MSKNGSRYISIKQYRFTDLFLFALILALAELLSFVAVTQFSDGAMFTVTFLVPITLIVMMRWGWYGTFYAIGDGLLYCLIHGAGGTQYAIYIIGNTFIALVLLLLRFMGKKRIAGKWYFSVLFTVVGWFCVCIGRTLVATCFGAEFFAMLGYNCGFGDTGLMSLAMAVIIILVLRRFNGMFEDQKLYLLRMDKDRRDKMRRDEFGDELAEINEEDISILKRDYEE